MRRRGRTVPEHGDSDSLVALAVVVAASECQASVGNGRRGRGPDGAAAETSGRLRVARDGSGLERGSGGRKRGLQWPWAAEGDWERGPPRPTDARAQGARVTREAESPQLPSSALPGGREVGSDYQPVEVRRSRSGAPLTPLHSPRRSQDARGLAASVLGPHWGVAAAGGENSVTLRKGPCGMVTRTGRSEFKLVP